MDNEKIKEAILQLKQGDALELASFPKGYVSRYSEILEEIDFTYVI